MWKKMLSIAVIMSLLGQNMLFAQTASPKVPLSTVQHQALASLATIQVGDYYMSDDIATVIVAAVGMIAVGGTAYALGRNAGYYKGYWKAANEAEEQTSVSVLLAKEQGHNTGKRVGYIEGLNLGHKEGYRAGVRKGQEVGYEKGRRAGYSTGLDEGMGYGKEWGYWEGLSAKQDYAKWMRKVQKEDPILFEKLQQAVEESSTKRIAFLDEYFYDIAQAEGQQYARLNEQMKALGFSKEERKFLFQSKEWQPELFSFDKGVAPVLRKLATKPGRLSTELMHVVLRSQGLLAVGLLVLVATTAQANDSRMANRIVANPQLFLKANAEELRQIEQDPAAEAYCREMTEGLQQLAALPEAERNEVLAQIQQTAEQEKVASKRLQKSLRQSVSRVKAR